MDIGMVAAAWLHVLGMIVVLGYYGTLGRVALPGLRRTLDGETLVRTVAAIERRALPIVILGIVLFMVTGVVLLVNDDRYGGLGNLFANTWSTLLAVKHGVVILMFALGVAIDRLIAGLPELASDDARQRGVGTLELAADGITGMGALVLLLTVIAQAS